MGGLGNQLFQICFANYLKENGVNVYISEQWFFNNRQLKILPDRKPIFDLNHFDLKRTSRKNQLNLKFFERVSEIPIFQKQLTKKIFQQFARPKHYQRVELAYQVLSLVTRFTVGGILFGYVLMKDSWEEQFSDA